MIDSYYIPEVKEAIDRWANEIRESIDEEVLNKLIKECKKMETIEGNVTIAKQEYARLLVSEMTLNRLEMGGVDNWEWYGESLNPDDEPNIDEAEETIITHVKGLTDEDRWYLLWAYKEDVPTGCR